MSYKLTPEQYKDAAQRRIDNPNTAENTNSAVSAYARMLNANRAMDNKNLQKQTKEPEDVALETDEEQDEPSWFRRVLSTITAPIVRFTEGVAKFVENTILDAGAGLIASVADLFGADETAKDIQSWAAQDIVGEAFDWEPIQNIYNNSYSNDWGKFGEILQEGIYAVGNQAIPFALNFISGVGHAISATTYFVGGYGSGFESASQDGGSVLGASAYGLISAGLETAIEQGFGGAMKWGDKAGKGLKGVISKVAKSPAAQKAIGVVMDAAGEGAEEVVSGFLNNYIKAMTYQGDYSSVQSYFNNILNAEPATQEELLEQFFIGAMAGGMMTGAHSVVRMSSPSLNTRETIAEMDELREKGYNLNQRGKDTTATETEYAEKEADLVALVNKNLQKFEDKKANGNKDSAYILDYMDKNFNRDESGNFTTSKNGLVKTENVSYGTTEADIERAVTSQGNTVHNGALEGVSAQAKSNVEKALKNINKSLGKKRLNLVVADIAVKEDGTRDYGYLAGNTIVVDASMLGTDVEFTVVENDKPIKYKVEAGISTLLHEVFHVAEDTKAGKKLRDTLAQYAIDNDVETVNEIEGAYAKDSLKVQYSELSARQLERLLFNEKIIHRLTEDNSTLAKKILHKAERLLKALKGENLHETKSLETLLNKTVKLYNKAIVQVGKGKTYQVVSRKALDKEDEIEYSRRTPYYQYRSLAMQWANNNNTKVGDLNIIFDERAGAFKLIQSTKENEGYIEVKTGNYEQLKECLENAREAKRENYAIDENIARYESIGNADTWDLLDTDKGRRNGRASIIYQEQSLGNGTRNNERSGKNSEEISLIDIDNDGEDWVGAIVKKVYNQDIRHSRRANGYKYAPRDTAQITEADYNHHAWATANGVLSQNESGMLMRLIGRKKLGDKFPQDTDGLYMIAVGENGIENKVVFTDGDWESPSVEKVVVCKSQFKDIIEGAKEYIYESEKRGIQREIPELFEYYYAEDYGYVEWGKKLNTMRDDFSLRGGERDGRGIDSEIRRSRRVISREDINNAVEDTLNMLTAVGNIDENAFDVSLESKNKLLSVYVTQLKEQAVNGRLTEKSKTVKNLVNAIFDNAVLTENYMDDLGESAMLLTSLRPYLRSIDLSAPSIKADVQQRYGKQNNIFRLWGKKNGGVAWDSALQAILEDVPALAVDTDGQGNNEISTLFNVFDSYTQAVADMKKQRESVSSVVRNVEEVKRYMARQLVLSLNESGTELVTKLTADKLQSIINEERNALQETLRAVKNGESEIAFQGQNLSAKAKQQLGEIVEVISKERASVYAEKKADVVVSHIKKGVTAEEMRDVRKTEAYKKMSEYIAEQRLKEGKEVSIKSIEESNPTAVFGLKQAITSVRNVRTLESGNANVLKQIRDMDTTLLKQRAQELTLEETPITLIDELHEAVNALYKKTEDGKRKMLTYKEMISSGGLKNLTSVFRNYCVDGNPIIQDLKDSGMFDGVVERLEAYEKYVEALDAEAYANMSLMERQTFHNAFAMFLAEVVRATKPTTNITVDGKTVSMKKYRDKSLRRFNSSLPRGRNGEKRGAKRAIAKTWAKYFQASVRPNEAIARAENYAGALETLFEEVRQGEIKGANARIDLEKLFVDFVEDKANRVNGKSYDSVLLKDEITIAHSEGTFTVTKGELIGLYLTLVQEDGFRHADANNPMAKGIYFDDKKHITDYRNKTALKFTAENLVAMENTLSERDLRFIEKVREFFAKAGQLKAEVDTQLYGVARLLGIDYYPLRIDESARDSKLGDKVSFYDELDPSGHLSINQNRTYGLNALRVQNVLDVLNSYAKSVGLYYGVAIPVANMRLVYNSTGIYGDSIKTSIAKNSTDLFDKYLDKLLLDVQGAIKVSDSFLERQRQRYASFAVAANPKSPIKALSGLFSPIGILKIKSWAKGMIVSPFTLIKSGKANFAQMYEYCPATRVRYNDKQATLAAMNVERGSRAKNKLVDALAIFIELVDKYTVYTTWEGAKAEVGAVGANKNNPELLAKAGKLLNKSMDTLDRFEMTERNGFSRSEDSLSRGVAMFTSSSQAQLTQFLGKTFRLAHLYNQKKHLPLMIQEANAEKAKYEKAVADETSAVEKARQSGDTNAEKNAEYRLREAKAKLNDTTLLIGELHQQQATIDADIKKASLFTRKTIVSISMAIVASAALSKLMDRLMGNDDEEDEEKGTAFVYGMIDESLSNVFGMLPLIGQFYNALEFNIGEFEKKSYDMSFWVIDEWNALADALNGFVALMDGSGTKSPARVARDFAYALGQWFGIPTRNLFNAMNTVLQVSPSAHYAVNDWFSKGNYGSDLKKAIDSKDTELADTIVRLMMKDTFGDTDTKVVKTVRSLYEQGYTGVIPKTVSSSITINGESYEMTKKQQATFKRTYSQADTAIEKLIGKQSFTTLSAKVQADSIKWIYDYYYQKAKEELTGIEDDSKKALFGSYINVETLAVAYSYCKSLEADTDKKGNAVVGTRKVKVVKYLNSLRLTAAEKYMILGYLGYSPVNNNAEMMITAFARKNGASKTEIEELLAMCNIAA